MSKLAATALRNNIAETLNRVAYQGERIELERHGKTVAALVSKEDLATLQAIEDRMDLEAAREALLEPGQRSWDELRTELGL